MAKGRGKDVKDSRPVREMMDKKMLIFRRRGGGQRERERGGAHLSNEGR